MGYYMAGDYYAAGGLFDFIGSAVKGIAKIASPFLPGPIGGIAGLIGGTGAQQLALPQGPGAIKAPGVGGVIARALPGGSTGYVDASGKPVRLKKDGTPYKKPTMNVGNARALRRSIRRQTGFVKLARRALKGTGYRIATTRSTRRDLPSGHSHVR